MKVWFRLLPFHFREVASSFSIQLSSQVSSHWFFKIYFLVRPSFSPIAIKKEHKKLFLFFRRFMPINWKYFFRSALFVLLLVDVLVLQNYFLTFTGFRNTFTLLKRLPQPEASNWASLKTCTSICDAWMELNLWMFRCEGKVCSLMICECECLFSFWSCFLLHAYILKTRIYQACGRTDKYQRLKWSYFVSPFWRGSFSIMCFSTPHCGYTRRPTYRRAFIPI